MLTTGTRRGGWAAALAVAALTTASIGTAQPPTPATMPKLLSELPAPRAGVMVTLARAEAKVKLDEDGLQEVSEMVAGAEETVIIPSTNWTLDADGWFDVEGFNVTKAFPRSGLWALRTVKGNRPPTAAKSGLEDLVNPSASPLLASPPTRLYRAGPGDIITHIGGVAVTSYERFVYALNAADNKRDVPVVVMDGNTGRRRLYYVTLFKEGP